MLSIGVITGDRIIVVSVIMCNLFSHDTHTLSFTYKRIDGCCNAFHFHWQLFDDRVLRKAFINYSTTVRPANWT